MRAQERTGKEEGGRRKGMPPGGRKADLVFGGRDNWFPLYLPEMLSTPFLPLTSNQNVFVYLSIE